MNLHSQQTREDRVPIWDINQVVFVLVQTQFDRNRLVKILLSEIQNKQILSAYNKPHTTYGTVIILRVPPTVQVLRHQPRR